MLSIRECRLEDYEGCAIICSLTRPEAFTAQDLIDEDAADRLAGTLHRLVAEGADGQILGYAYASHMPWDAERNWTLYAVAHPEHRRQGVGTALYQAAEAIAVANGATALTAWCRSEDPGNFAWAQRHGYTEDLLRTESVLDLTDWDGSRFDGLLERIQETGIHLVTFDGDVPPAIVAGLWDLERLTAPDVPDYEPDAPFPSLDLYQQQWYAYNKPRLTAVALDGERVVGATWLNYTRPAHTGGYTGYTGVLREYRGRSIALAVKLLTVEGAVARGVPRMRTNNDFENPAMLAVNEKLGYKLVPGPQRIKKSLV